MYAYKRASISTRIGDPCVFPVSFFCWQEGGHLGRQKKDTLSPAGSPQEHAGISTPSIDRICMFFYVEENDIGTRAIAEAAIATQLRVVPFTNCPNFVQVWFYVYIVHLEVGETHFSILFDQFTLFMKNSRYQKVF